MSVPAVRRVIVGVDGSVGSIAALRWACREATLRGAEVHVVHVREELCHSVASYAVPAPSAGGDAAEASVDVGRLVRSVQADQAPGARVRVEVADGLAARVLLDRCAGADMLVLGNATDASGALRSPGPVLRACLRRAPCPVVVISAAQDPLASREGAPGRARIPAAAGV